MDRKLTGLMSVFLLSFALFLSLVFLNTRLGRSSQASSSLKASTETSFVLTFPLEIASGSPQTSTITVFIRDPDTKPLPRRTVSLSATDGVIDPTTVVTDNDGKATAQFTCGSAAPSTVAQIHAIMDDNLELTKTVSVKCD